MDDECQEVGRSALQMHGLRPSLQHWNESPGEAAN
jgi:hypothetical protein